MVNKFAQAQAFISGTRRVYQAPIEVAVLPTDSKAQIYQEPVEVAVLPTDVQARTYQIVVEVLITNFLATGQAQVYIKGRVRLSQEPIEVIILPTDQKGRISQEPLEVILSPTDLKNRLSQLVFEVLIKTNQGSGQAQALIRSNLGFGQALAFINSIGYGLGQAQAKINSFDNSRSGQAQSLIVVRNNNSYGQTQAFIVKSKGLGQAQAYIILTGLNKFGQAQAFIGHFQHGQAQAQIITFDVNRYGQAQARVITFGVNQFGQAQTIVGLGLQVAQAQAKIKATVNGYGQAAAIIGHQAYGQAQGYLRAFNQNSYGNAQADIKVTYRAFGQALAAIKHSGSGQAQADIVHTYTVYGQANVYVRPRVGIGNAQARIIAFDVNGYAQANARILTTYYAVGNAKAFITKAQGVGQALAQIKTDRTVIFGQARVAIGHLFYGQAQAFISKTTAKGQAQADIKAKGNAYSQAQALIRNNFGFGQATADIFATSTNFGQAQALVDDRFALAQALALIVRTFNGFGQALGRIKNTYYPVAQAQAVVYYVRRVSAQAQARIQTQQRAIGQAQTQIGGFKYAQAQAQITGYNVPRIGQAMGYILADISVTPRATSYLVKFGANVLPGYAQSEGYDSIEIIASHPTLSQYLGLENKSIDLIMEVWEPTYDEVKKQVFKAATILRNTKGRFEKLYIQTYDAYYLALTNKVKMEKAVRTSMRIADYSVVFETKPWLISNALYETSGIGTIETTNRTLADGTWTPTRVLVSGTDITITGITESGAATGTIEIEGSVSDLLIDTEAFTATENGVNKNAVLNKDYSLYVGPGRTIFTISGATSCVIQYNNRWVLVKGGGRVSAQPLAATPIVGIVHSFTHGLARVLIASTINIIGAGQANAYIQNPTKYGVGQAQATIFSHTHRQSGQANATIVTSRKLKTGQARVVITPSLPDAPSGLVATPGNSTVTLTWS